MFLHKHIHHVTLNSLENIFFLRAQALREEDKKKCKILLFPSSLPQSLVLPPHKSSKPKKLHSCMYKMRSFSCFKGMFHFLCYFSFLETRSVRFFCLLSGCVIAHPSSLTRHTFTSEEVSDNAKPSVM